ncbi:hypothetical protein PV328_005128 [Microctonus aethiopoides]|uniref:DM10 domain-containing protein n=1 Tax=Microctonus aethiopoides TaxID=144406 RepID=A0AA39FLX3_9HYME|nr:hypothetical protein PV328_005128 [Microctonus aethiopoides]
MEDIPLIPGYSFRDCVVRDHKIKHKLKYSDGCRTICDSNVGIGRRPVDSSSSAYAQDNPEEVVYDPTLTYGRVKHYPYRPVIPHYVLYAQKCLKFNAYFRENVSNSSSEYHRVRHVNIIYFLEDDTICVVEPPVDNAGLVQGKLVSRAKIPKNKNGIFYHWKDLNVGIDIVIYGVIYHTVNCDAFTSEFLRSQGIDLGAKEVPPPDSYIQDRLEKATASQTAFAASKRAHLKSQDIQRRMLEYTGMVLTFEAIWNDDFYQVMYFLMDDTIMVKGIASSNDGKDPHRVLLKRMKVPKNWADVPISFPSIYLERSDEEVVEYYAPIDLMIGQTIFIYGRSFFLYDCDDFTRKYYSKMLNIEQPSRMLPANLEPPSHRKVHNQARPRTSLEKGDNRKKDVVIRNIFSHPHKLRYLASMVAIHPEDEGRDFVFEYNLSDGKLKINEIGKRNSGHRAGCFLSFMHVPKPKKRTDDDNCNYGYENTDVDDDETNYYTPEDFFIGAHINVFNHRFIIEGADIFVFQYIQANPEKFSPALIENMNNYFMKKEMIKDNSIEQQDQSQEIIKEPILPVKSRVDSPLCVQKADPILAYKEICKLNEKAKNERASSSRQISWADQVQVPCRF